jgi:hypothetical protein
MPFILPYNEMAKPKTTLETASKKRASSSKTKSKGSPNA